MIKVGELKRDDVVLLPEKGIGTVCGIEYSRTVDDEWEKVSVAFEGNPELVDFYTPTSQIKKFPFKVGDRVECVNRWIFDDRIQVGDRGYIDSIKNSGQVFVKFDKVYQLQQCSRPEEHLRKIEEKREEKMIKVGDIVTVKCGKDTENKYGINSSMEAMERENKGYEVTDIRNGDILVEVKDGHNTWNFHINDVKLFNKGEEKMKKEQQKNKKDVVFRASNINYKVIVNEPAVILFVDTISPFTGEKTSKKYVSKAYNQEFDPEVGLAMCLLKLFGISYLDFKRILATAKKEEKKVEENKNQVKVKKETIKKENIIVSPKGKKKGKPFTFFVGDEVVVRECERYTHTTNANAKMCLNKVLKIQEDKSDWAGTCYVVNGHEFSGSELEPFKK